MKTVLPEPALDKAMQLFWMKGFFNTSIDDLVTSTGMNRATIYKHFNGKNGLFIAVLQRFKSNITQHVQIETINGYDPIFVVN